MINSLRAAFIDLDGTLLLGSDLSPENYTAVRRLEDRGMLVVLATGRHPLHTEPYYRKLGLTGPIVSADGALVHTPSDSVSWKHERNLDPRVVDLVQQTTARREVTCLSFTSHGIYVGSKYDWNDNMERHSELGDRFGYRLVKPREETVYKMLLYSATPDALDALQSLLGQSAWSGLTDMIRNPNTLEFVHKGVSKVTALEIVAEKFGFAAQDAIAIGDGVNDVGMFRWAGHSLCMHHAPETVRTKARRIAKPSHPRINLAVAIAELFGDESTLRQLLSRGEN